MNEKEFFRMRHQLRQRTDDLYLTDGICNAMWQMEVNGLLESYQDANGEWMCRLTPKGVKEAEMLARRRHTKQVRGLRRRQSR